MFSYPAYNDAQLLELLKTGDEAAFAEVYDRHHKVLYAYLATFTKNRAVAEDMVHDIFLLLWEKKAALHLTKDLRGYLLGICHHKAVDTVKQLVKEQHLREELTSWYAEAVPDAGLLTDEGFSHTYSLALDALNRLSPQRRKVFELCKMEGKTYKEAAAILNISPHTVKEYMSSALAALKGLSAENSELALALLLLVKIL